MNDDVSNLFVHQSAARRYAAARPDFHPLVARRISAFSGRPRFRQALDAGCGTGQSARALAAIAGAVTAIDISPAMLAEAERHERVTYLCAPAETLPFRNGAFDLITAGLAFHWFDQTAFLREAHRVLEDDGRLVIFHSGFTGRMSENERFSRWAKGPYHERFPKPARRAAGVSAPFAESHGFELAGRESFGHVERMSVGQLAAYLATQSNVIARVENGTTTIDEALGWIEREAAPFFEGEASGSFEFTADLWHLRPRRPPA